MAMLPLSAMDPSRRNRQQAEQALESLVQRRRKNLSRAATIAACASGAGGSNIPDQPDFMLPYAVFILAHHPDFPEVRRRMVRHCCSHGGPATHAAGGWCRRRTLLLAAPRSWTRGRR